MESPADQHIQTLTDSDTQPLKRRRGRPRANPDQPAPVPKPPRVPFVKDPGSWLRKQRYRINHFVPKANKAEKLMDYYLGKVRCNDIMDGMADALDQIDYLDYLAPTHRLPSLHSNFIVTPLGTAFQMVNGNKLLSDLLEPVFYERCMGFYRTECMWFGRNVAYIMLGREELVSEDFAQWRDRWQYPSATYDGAFVQLYGEQWPDDYEGWSETNEERDRTRRRKKDGE